MGITPLRQHIPKSRLCQFNVMMTQIIQCEIHQMIEYQLIAGIIDIICSQVLCITLPKSHQNYYMCELSSSNQSLLYQKPVNVAYFPFASWGIDFETHRQVGRMTYRLVAKQSKMENSQW